MKQKICIFTAEPRNEIAKNFSKAAESSGAEAFIIDVNHCVIGEGVDGSSSDGYKASSALYHVDNENKKLDVIKIDENTVVIPRISEHHLDVKLSMLARMKDSGAKMLNTIESMDLCNDKLMSQVTLNTAGIKTPYSFTMQNALDVETVVDWMASEERPESERLVYPIIVKTLRGTHGIGVMKLDSRASLVSVAQMLLKEEIEFMVQQYFEHEQSARIIMIGDKVLAANLRGQPKDKGEFRTNSHLGSETEPYEPPEEEIELGKKIVELFGCNFCAIDYIILDKGGKKEIIVLEVNGSPGLEGIQKNWPDKDLPKDVITYALSLVKSELDQDVQSLPEPVVEPTLEPEVEVTSDEEVINSIEPVLIHRITEQPIQAKIDTGATTSSLHVDHVDFDESTARFKRGDITFKVPVSRIVHIKNLHDGENSERPVVRLDVTIHGQRFNQVEFNLTDRSSMKYEALIGRNVLEQLGLPVMIPKVAVDPNSSESQVKVEEE